MVKKTASRHVCDVWILSPFLFVGVCLVPVGSVGFFLGECVCVCVCILARHRSHRVCGFCVWDLCCSLNSIHAAPLAMDRKAMDAQEALIKGAGVEDSMAFLKSTGVYDHVAALLMRLAAEKPKNALDVFENVSTQVKAMTVKFPAGTESKRFDEAKDRREVMRSEEGDPGRW